VSPAKHSSEIAWLTGKYGLARIISRALAIRAVTKNKTGFLGQKITVGTRGIFGFSTIVGLLWNKSVMVCTMAMTEND
jgi:hypothetical protein